MKKSCLAFLALLAVTTVAAAEDFDGSQPLTCRPLQGHDCLPGQSTCKPLEPRLSGNRDFGLDVAKKTFWSPYRTADLPIDHVSTNRDSLVLQGKTLELVWSATVHRKTGRLTVAIADREGAYVVFGQCKVGKIAPPAK